MPNQPTKPMYSPLTTEDELAYRREFLQVDRRHIRLFAALTIVFNLLFIYVDWRVVGNTPLFVPLLIVRLTLAGLAGVMIRAIERVNDPDRFDRLVLGWALSLSLFYVPILYSRPPDFTANIIPDAVIIAAFHLYMPDRPGWRVLPGLAYGLVSLFGLFFLRNPLPELTLWSVLASNAFSHLIGIGGMHILQKERRLTWRAQKENHRHLASQAQHAEMKNRLVSMLSHEYRTPLNAITSSAALLGEYYDRMDSAQRQAVIERIATGSARLTELLDRATFIVRSNSERLNRELAEIDVAVWIHATEKELHALYPDCHIEKQHCEKGGTRQLDVFLLRMIVSNLISNSYKYSPKKASKSITFTCDAAALSIMVSDAGPGIPDNERAQLFEPFFRGAASLHTQGSGMGLPIVKEAVELLEGSIELSSQPGQTTFTVRLPWLEKA